jgi:thiol-disulfide isomerase/thioredoxin
MTNRTERRAKRAGGSGPKKSGRRVPVLGIVFGAIAVLLVLAVVLSSGDSTSAGDVVADVAGDPAITGATLPPFQTGAATVADDPAVGMKIPAVGGQDFSGNNVSITDDGVPKMIVFLAHWCPHCQAEVPRIQSWLNSTGGVAGVDLYSVTTSYDPGRGNWPPSDWLSREGWTVPVIRDDADSTLLSSFGGSSFPYFVFVNSANEVVLRVSGEVAIDILSSMIQGLPNM